MIEKLKARKKLKLNNSEENKTEGSHLHRKKEMKPDLFSVGNQKIMPEDIETMHI